MHNILKILFPSGLDIQLKTRALPSLTKQIGPTLLPFKNLKINIVLPPFQYAEMVAFIAYQIYCLFT